MSNQITPPFPQLSIENFLKRYPSEKRRKRMAPLYESSLAAVQSHALPKALYAEFSLDQLPALKELFQAESISAILALCTLGEALDQYQHQLNQEDIVSAAISDEIALAAVVAITNQLHAEIRRKMQTRGLKAGPAYRPGIGRWPIEAQQQIFELLPAHKIQVTLSEFLVMTPKMSTTLIIPILDKLKK